ncbi:MAG TPA: ABC transporter ATP-binding protein [Candidatus Acidoferrum sp.]|nr:ABC transporter ATP-binding protein [Candidatus Acidoferrum sp.]
MSAADVLSLDAVDKVYRPRRREPVHAVKGLSMEVRPGETVALLGSSGCGKTSTLRMIAGFEAVTNGAIAIKGRPIHQLPPAKRNVAMAFEGYSLYPPLTVRDNIAFALKSARLPKAEEGRRVQDVAALLEITDILDRYPSSISGGQQQRASLGRALVREADLYLLDEPMGQLEPQLRAILRGRLKHYLRERRMTSVLVTHDQTEANALADRIAVMEGGVLQQIATPRELKERPANLFVGTFIGEPPMNVLETRPEQANGRIRFAIAGGQAFDYAESEVAPPLRAALAARAAVTLGIRPHAIHLGQPRLRARVLSNQWLGDQTHVAAEIAGRLIVAVAHQRVAARVGEEIPFDVAASDLHLFDSQSGAVIAHGGRPT